MKNYICIFPRRRTERIRTLLAWVLFGFLSTPLAPIALAGTVVQQPQPHLTISQVGGIPHLTYDMAGASVGIFFIMQSTKPGDVDHATVLFQGDTSVTSSGTIPLTPEQATRGNYFFALRDPSLVGSDLVEEIDDEEPPPSGPSYYLDGTGIPSTFASGEAFALSIDVNSADRVLQPVCGTVELGLLDANGLPVAFAHTLTPTTLPVENGLASAAITLTSTNSLSNIRLGASFAPAPCGGAQALSGLVWSSQASSLKAPLKAKMPKAWEDWRDQSESWLHPLGAPTRLTGTFGEWPGHSTVHKGIDFSAPVGTPVYAVKKGIVTFARAGGAGVTLDHGNGTISRYTHVQRLTGLEEEDIVEPGQLIGHTALLQTTAAHLHFELRSDPEPQSYARGVGLPGTPFNPLGASAPVFTPLLAAADNTSPMIEALFLRSQNPALRPERYDDRGPLLPPTGAATTFFIARTVDIQDGSRLAPRKVTFSAGSPLAVINFDSPLSNIEAFKGNPAQPGYTLPHSSDLPVRSRRYQFWAPWDTLVYTNDPNGPVTVDLTVEDYAGHSTTDQFKFGPQLEDVPAAAAIGCSPSIRFSIRAFLGPTPNPPNAGQELDTYTITATVTSAEPVGWTVQFETPAGTNEEEWPVSRHDEVRELRVRVNPLQTSSTPIAATLVLEARSARFPGILHRKEVAITYPPPAPPAATDFALIPAGAFQMGDPLGDGDPDELPVHTVFVSAFYMEKYEVSYSLWNQVRNWGASRGYSISAGSGKAASHPVHTVSWSDVVKWCNARSEMDGLNPRYYTDEARTQVYRAGSANLTNEMVDWHGCGYRLPTEAEWEKAARGGLNGQRFPWGANITHAQANYKSSSSYPYDTSPTRGYHPIYLSGATPYTGPVGSFAPNGYGLHDMAGNVWEWNWDRYLANSYASLPSTDPKGPSSGSTRVVRGGAWFILANGARCADRYDLAPDSEFNDRRGFRCAR